jgi:hypothetical protein
LLPWNQECAGVFVTEPSEVDLKCVRDWLTKPFVYDIGSHQGCACPFIFQLRGNPPSEEALLERDAASKDFRDLAAYLETILATIGVVEIYNAWDYWEPRCTGAP